MNEADAQDHGRDPDDGHAPLTPELRRAVAALRHLPPTSPGALARVTAAVAADGGGPVAAVEGARARPGSARRWVAAGLAAAAAGIVLLVAGGRGPWSAPSPVAASAAPAASPAAPRSAVRAVGNALDAAGDAPRPVTFAFRRPGARSVAVVGDFNQWDARATPLVRGPDGGWVATLPLAPGRHAYRFVVDDSLRVLDPHAPAERDADLGVARSIVVVGAP